MTNKQMPSRRDFLKGSTAAVAGAALVGGLNISRTAHAAGGDQIKIALIGCGGRGNGAVTDSLSADPAVKVIAVADAFEDRAQKTADRLRNHKEFSKRVDLPDTRVFVGLEAYKQAIAAGPDICILTTPPGFRPMLYAAAIEAGKHVFMEKPCCVDAAGFRSLMETNKVTDAKGLKVGVGFQRRHNPSYMETVKRIQEGAIGTVSFLRAYWNGSGIWYRKREPGMTEMQFQVHNWYHFCWLSGDNICEQHIHNLDVCNWVKNDHPVEANGMGGCTARYLGEHKGMGQIFDHHFVEYTYADGSKMFSQCRHMQNCFNSVSEAVHGTNGEANPAGSIKTKDQKEWKFEAPRRSGKSVSSMVQEHMDLIAAIRSGAKYNEGYHGATSSMTAVLGRMATYSGQVVKWDDAIAKGKTEFPTELSWNAKAPVQPDKDGNYPIPMPGVYKAY
jgi:myo-inositol 2-dehydrogenase / D-chiro-inositol 1-dehydrogenase